MSAEPRDLSGEEVPTRGEAPTTGFGPNAPVEEIMAELRVGSFLGQAEKLGMAIEEVRKPIRELVIYTGWTRTPEGKLRKLSSEEIETDTNADDAEDGQ